MYTHMGGCKVNICMEVCIRRKTGMSKEIVHRCEIDPYKKNSREH